MVSFRNRSMCLDEVSNEFLRLLVALGGYCTALQAQELIGRSGNQIRALLRMLERLGFLRRITKYPLVYQVTKSTTRLLGRDSSSRRRHTLVTVQSRLMAVHFYLEARAWPAEFIFDHEKKVAVFTDAGFPMSDLPQQGGKPYLREHLFFWLPDWRIAIAMVDEPGPGALWRLKLFISQFLPLLRYFRQEPDLLIVTADEQRRHLYERLLKRHRAIHKLGMGELSARVRPYRVRPPVPSITEVTWPKADRDALLEVSQGSHDLSHTAHSQMCQRHIGELISD